MAITDFWDKKASEYSEAKEDFYKSRDDSARDKLCSGLNLSKLKSQKILDAGCGTGEDVNYFHNLGADVIGVDSSKEMIILATKKFPELSSKFSVQNLKKTNIKDNFFDIVYSRYAIHCSEDINKIFEEFARILKSNGLLLILVAHPLLGFLSKKSKNYYKKEVYDLKIFDKEFCVSSPSHTISEYLNQDILKNFELIEFYESEEKTQSKENRLSWIVPDFMILKLKKR